MARRRKKASSPSSGKRRARRAKAKPSGAAKGDRRWATGYSLEKDGTTQSLLNGAYCACTQAAAFYLDGWRSVGTKASLSFGSLIHKGLEDWYGAGMVEVNWEAWLEAYSVTQRAKGADAAATEMDCALAGAVLPAYCERYAKEDSKKEWIGVESKFDVRWNGYRLRGMCDGLFKSGKKRKTIALFETKTKGRIEVGAIEDALAYDFQNQFYMEANEAGLGIPDAIKRVLYNIIRRPGQKLGKNESLADFQARIAADIKKRPEHYFIRYEISYPQAERKKFREELLMKLQEFEAWLKGERPTYRNQGSCQRLWKCSYISACASGTMAGYDQKGRLFEELED